MKKLFVFMSFAMIAMSGAVMGQQQHITLEDIWTKRTFAPRGIGGIRSMADGEHYCSLSRTGIAQYSYKTGAKTADLCLFNAPQRKHKAKPLTVFTGYAFSADEQKILLSGEFEPIYRRSGVSSYWIYDRPSDSFVCLTINGKQRLTTLSPDGTKAAFVRDNNLYWIDLSTLEEHAITTDGKVNHIINGTTDWVYEEEFAITQGFQWSPDSKQIAYMRFDESQVKEYNMQMWGELYPDDYRYKYPKAGESNSQVEIRIFKLESNSTQYVAMGGKTNAVASGSEWEYIPRFQWANDNTLAVMRMNRLQNHMQVLTISSKKTGSEPDAIIYDEQDNAYVEVPDTWQFLTIGNGKNATQQMLITSERDGYRHIYLYDMQGRLVKQITSGSWEVASVCAVDTKGQRLYYTSNESGAINTDLYMIDFSGKHKTCLNHRNNAPFINRYPANNTITLGTYNAHFSQGCKYYICTFSDANTPPIYTLHTSTGKLVKVLEDNSALRNTMNNYGVGNKRFGTLTTRQGTELNYYTIVPPDFDSTKQHPLFFYVYGGPGNQQVTNSYGYSDYYWFHLLAEQGYVVACFDGRGTGGRGANFKKQTYRDLGHMECDDAIEAALWFGKQPWIDRDRIGIFGWSFGGYLSSLSILKGNDVFKSAIAVAPVITWRYYDNIYTERFLALPQTNAEGYDNNSPLNYASQLKGNYLLVHGTGDDNVHFQNAAMMADALEKAGKQFEMRIYPNKNHSIYDNTGNTRLNLYQMMTDFILRKL